MTAWKIIFLLSCMAFWEITFTKAGLIEYAFLFGNIDGVNTGVMWYMVSFLVVLFFFPVSQYLFHDGKKGRKLLFYIMCLMFAGSIMITGGNFVLHLLSRYIKGAAHLTVDGAKQMMPFTNSANMLFYFILGGFLFEYREKITQLLEKWHGRTWIPVLLIVTGTAGLIMIKYTYTGSFVWGNAYLKDGYLRFATVVLSLGVYLFFMAKERRGAKVLFAGIGKYTMGIYYLHYLILIFVSKFVFPYLTPYVSFGLNLVKTIVITLLCVLISWIMRKIPLLKQLVE